jgi:ABC-type transporter MlaC component
MESSSRARSGRGMAGRPIKVDWRLTAQNGFYKVSDIIVEGLSMAAHGRSQLEGVVERNGGRPQAILAVLRQQIAAAAAR